MHRSANNPLLGPLVRRLRLTLATKWTLAIALLLALGMGVLGTYLIQQQEGAFERQSTRLGELLAEQLGRLVAEPLLAEDELQLQLLVNQTLDGKLDDDKLAEKQIVGAAVLDLDGKYRAIAGQLPTEADVTNHTAAPTEHWIVELEGDKPIRASVHIQPIAYPDVQAGADVQAGKILLSLNRAPLESDRRKLVNALFATTVLLIVFVGLLAFPLAHWMSDPIRRLVAEERKNAAVNSTLPEQGFDGIDEVGYLAKRLQRLTTDAQDKRQVEEVLNRYLSPGVVRSVLAAGSLGVELEGRSLRGSVLFCDIVGFTRLAQGHTPEQLAELVNEYFGAFARSGTFFRGTVDKFIGDCIMILFGVPEPDPQHALQAIMCGAAMIQLSQAINVQRQAIGKPTVDFRVAINSGLMRAGNLGNLERMEFTVVGSSVNLASRLCERSPVNSLALTADTLSESGVAAKVLVKPMGTIEIKGYDEPLDAFVVQDLGPEVKTHVHNCLQMVADTPQVTV